MDMNDDRDDALVTPESSVYLVVNRQIIPLKKRVTKLGRQMENDIVFHEDFLSRFHAEIHYEEGKYILNDLDSTSGTFVNSRKINRCELNSGDLISLANVQIMFVNNNPVLAGNSKRMTQSLGGNTLSTPADKHE
jgi:pSer/pThr/pTyr-binding forkhead associated (FHA) protein